MAQFQEPTTQTGNGASIVATFPTHAVGDLLLVFATNDGGGTAITVSAGWATLGTQAASAGCRSAWCYKVATGTSGEDPTISGANDDWCLTKYVVTGANATPFGATPASGTDFYRLDYDLTSKGKATLSAGALTTATDNCLLLIGIGQDATSGTFASAGFKPNPDDICLDTSVVMNTGGISHVTGHLQMGAAGATPAIDLYANTLDGGNVWIIAIRNATSGPLMKDVRTGVEVGKWHGDFGNTLETLGYVAPHTAVTSNVGGIATSTTVPTVSTLADAPMAPGSMSSFADATNGGANVWSGATWPISATDYTGTVAVTRWQLSSTGSPVGTKGVIDVFVDGSGNWVAYRLVANPAASEGIAASLSYQAAVAVGAATEYASSLTESGASGVAVDLTDIRYRGVWYERVALSGTGRTIYVANDMILRTAKLIGGDAVYPVKLSDLPTYTKLNGLPFVNQLQGSGQVLPKGKVQIGDGSTPTYFKIEAQSLEYSKAWDITKAENREWNASASSVGVTVYASANDTIDLSAGVMATSVRQPFTIHASSSLSASYLTSGFLLIGFNFTDNAGLDWVSSSFKQGGKATFAGGASLTNCIVKPVATVGDAAVAITANGSVLDGTEIDVTGTDATYHLELGPSVTAITLADVTFTGTASADKVHVLKTSGTVTITISGSTSLSAGDVTTAGATVDIVDPTASITISNAGLVSGTKVLLRNTTQDTELDIATVGGSGYSFGPVTVGAGEAIEVGDRIDIYGTWASGTSYKKNYHEAGVATLSDLTFIGTQEDWTDANNLATDGSAQTEFTADYPNIQVDIASPDNYIQCAKLAAWFIYNQTTDDGIRNYFGAVSSYGAVFTVATAVADILLDNTQATSIAQNDNIYWQRDDGAMAVEPVTSGGGGISLKMTGDVFVVSVAGSSVITGDKQEILDALAEGVNVVQINGVALTGAGTEANPMRPA